MSACPKCGTTYPPHVRICTLDGTVLEDAEAPRAASEAGTLLDRKYRLDAPLGKGGMGAVYKATHVMLGKPVAVKLIKADLVGSPDMVRRFQREARAATSLNHPNIVTVYDLGQTGDGTLYIAMEMVEGRSLKDEIVAGGPMAPARIVRLLTQTASALGAAHRHQIVHRDLKPQNLMVTRDARGDEVVKLLDFGIAKTLEEGATQLTQTGFALGTPQYMAPEQAAGKTVDGRTDLYALGVILYEMMTGEVPFNDPSTPAVLVKHLTEIPEPPSRRRPGLHISPTLEVVALKCLEKDPARRFQDADEFIAAIAAVANDPAPAPLDGATMLVPDPAITAPVRTGATAAPTVAGAPTMPTPAAAPPPVPQGAAAPLPVPAPPAIGAPPPVPAVAQGTRPTAPVAVPPPAAPAPAPAPPRPSATPPQASAKKGVAIALGVVAVVVLLFGAAAGLVLYRFGFIGGSTTEQAITDAPSSSPAMAPGDTAQPATPASGTPAEAQGGTDSGGTPGPDTPAAPPAAAAPATETGRTAAGTRTAATPPTPSAAASGTRVSAPAAPASQPLPVAPAIPPVPTVFVDCAGAAEICSALRTALVQAIEREGATLTRRAGSAHVVLEAAATAGETTTQQQFGTTFTVTSYTIEVAGEAPGAGGAEISMPAPRTFSFDQRFGRERLTENVRVLAGDAAERVMRFWKKHAGVD